MSDRESERDRSKGWADYESGDRLRPPAGSRRSPRGYRTRSGAVPPLTTPGEREMPEILERLEKLTGFRPPSVTTDGEGDQSDTSGGKADQ